MTKTMLAIGECMVELADAGDGLYRRGFAGDTFNTAWYARKLLPKDWRVGYVSAIGEDAVSGEMRDFIASQGIDTTHMRAIPDCTVGLYMISLTAGERSFSYWRSHSAARALADDPDWLAETLQAGDSLYFSGITLAILSPEARQVLCKALGAARSKGAQVAFDTNLRPRLWESTSAMQAGMRMGASVADVVLPSFDEEVTIFGDTNPDECISRYRDCGARIVAVKNGAQDLLLWDGQTQHSIPAITVPKVIDTTAAGDSFAAAFLAALAQGADAKAAATQAMALAAQVIQDRGALVPQLFLED